MKTLTKFILSMGYSLVNITKNGIHVFVKGDYMITLYKTPRMYELTFKKCGLTLKSDKFFIVPCAKEFLTGCTEK